MKLEYNKTDNYEDIMNTLEEYGVVVIKNFLEENDLKTLMSDYKNFYDSKIKDKKIVADRSVNFNTLRNKKERLKYLKSYLDIVYKNKDKINLKKIKMGG